MANKNQKAKLEASQPVIVFNDKKIRRILHNNEWWFSIVDVVEVLTESATARRYWTDMKRRLAETEGFNEVYANCVQLKFEGI